MILFWREADSRTKPVARGCGPESGLLFGAGSPGEQFPESISGGLLPKQNTVDRIYQWRANSAAEGYLVDLSLIHI